MFKWRSKHKKFMAIPMFCGVFYLMYSYLIVTDDFDFDAFYKSGVLKWYNYSDDSLNGPSVQMSDPKLIQKLKDNFLVAPPSMIDHKYRLKNPRLQDPSMGQGEKVRSILQNKKNGFFIEVGALDGETRSNTLYFERFLNWTGLLIEPDPLNFANLLRKNRNAWLSPTCVSIKSHPEIVRFEQNENMGKIVDTGVNDNKSRIPKGVVSVQCFPLYTYLLALNVTQVDYFSLDVEGVELDVLKTIPFNLLNIQTLSVEFAHVPGGKEAIHEYMFEQGYVMHSEVTHPDWLANDFIFMKID
ncbi:hypothetical protein GE061_003916 [Apolygus lucorum]|uniref:Methyltransferase FkbM domain-containing protein n=1 Tax=Apolygus lucorum TaxID=248454 RepID=A0A8S9X1R2_APOLU|nr:hypothetical protein GE061_003916 [Apolygus lucorum]